MVEGGDRDNVVKFRDLELDLYHSADAAPSLGQDLMLTEAGIKVEMGRNPHACLRKKCELLKRI